MTQTELTPTVSRTGKWRPYPAYKDSGVEWLGEIPAHWEVKRLKYIVLQRAGAIKAGPFGSQLVASEMIGGNIKVYNQRNVIERDFTLGDDYISVDKYEELSSFTVNPGDILLTTRGTIGRSYLLPNDIEPGILHPCLIRISPNLKLILGEFLVFLIQDSNLVQTQMSLLSNATTIEVIYSDRLRRVSIPVPPIIEQREILNYLDREISKIGTLIAKKERLIELLQEKRAALISHAVTKGLDPTVPMKDSGVEWLGEIPAHWKVKRLKYTAPSSAAKLTEKPDDLPYLGLENIESQTGRLLLDTPFEKVESTVSLFNQGNVLFGKLRPYLAKAVYADFSGVCTTELLVLQPNAVMNGKFLFYRLLSEDFIKLVNSLTYGTKMPRVSSEQIGNLPVPLPPLAEQRSIAAFIDSETAKIDALISRIRDGIEKLKEYSSALISAAVTGKIDVRGEIALQDDESL